MNTTVLKLFAQAARRKLKDQVAAIIEYVLTADSYELHEKAAQTRRQHLERVQISGTTAEKTQELKETERIDKLLLELNSYERDTHFPLATSHISINLDDGVLVNYNKFDKAIKEVASLNDKPTKKKVREFDWIDVREIRD